MDREIKFRGKSKETGKWLYGDLLRNEQGTFAVVPPFKMNMGNECNKYEVVEETVGQFTGLKDKNGIDIYEGDIVQWDECVADYKFVTNTSKVYYNETSCSFEPLEECFYCAFEVIGNYYDNPELLED